MPKKRKSSNVAGKSDAKRMRAARASETEAQRQARKEADRLATASALASLPEAQRQARQETNRLAMESARASQTEAQRQARQETDRLAHARTLSTEGGHRQARTRSNTIITTAAPTPPSINIPCSNFTASWIDEGKLNANSLSTSEEFDQLIFNSFERDPRASLLFYHKQSGLLREYEDEAEVLTPPTDEDVHEAVGRYNEHVGQEASLGACAGCREYLPADILTKKAIDSLEHLALQDDRKAAYMNLSTEGKKAHHVLEIRGSFYCVAPSLLHLEGTEHMGHFCKKCLLISPKGHSRFLDFDYGVPFPLLATEPFSPLNRLALARHIAYMVHVKLYASSGRTGSNAIKSHCFCVPHNGVSVVLDTVAVNKGCLRAFTLHFIGSGSAFEALRAGMKIKECAVQPDKSLQFLHYLCTLCGLITVFYIIRQSCYLLELACKTCN